MSRIAFALFTFAFIQLGNGQMTCLEARTALAVNEECTLAFFGTKTDISITCRGTCRTLFDNIMDNCDADTAAAYSSVINAFCDPVMTACATAQAALSSNATCVTAFSIGTDASILCMGTCRNLFNDIIDNCDATTTTAYSTLINTLCSSDTNTGACATAIAAVNDTCRTYLNNADSRACSMICYTQLNTVGNACANSSNAQEQVYATAYATLCGSGSQCTAAQAALNADTNCTNAIITDDVETACLGSCRTLIENVIESCNGSNAQEQVYATAYATLCGSGSQCTAAQAALNADTNCTNAIITDDVETACLGSCRTLIENAIESCNGSTAEFVAQCQCTAAQAALNATTSCVYAASSGDMKTACSGSCKSLIKNFTDACCDELNVTTQGFIREVDTLCVSAFEAHCTDLSVSDSNSLSNGAVIAIACTSITIIVIITFVVTCIFVKKKFTGLLWIKTVKSSMITTNTIVYKQVDSSSNASSNADMTLQPNPVYSTSREVVTDDPAYESCK